MVKFRNITVGFIFILLFAMLSGCASMNNASTIPPMALTVNPNDTGLSNKLVLMTLTIRNNLSLNFKPTVQTIALRNSDTKTIYQYAVDSPSHIANDYKTYLLSFSLPAGNYELLEAEGFSKYHGQQNKMDIPLHLHFKVEQEGVAYLGSINIDLQQQTNVASLWEGAMSPLVNRSNNDFSGSNYIIKVSDKYAEDMTDFSNTDPELIDQNIEKSIMLVQQQQLLEES